MYGMAVAGLSYIMLLSKYYYDSHYFMYMICVCDWWAEYGILQE